MQKLKTTLYAGYFLLLLLASWAPMPESVGKNFWDKGNHFIAYAIFFWLARMFHARWTSFHCVFYCFVVSVGIECVQYFLPYRSFEVLDILANFLGIVLGLCVYVILFRRGYHFGSGKP